MNWATEMPFCLPSQQIMFPELQSVEFQAYPFEHFLGQTKLPNGGAKWLAWLENEAPWQLTVTEFYEQYEFSLLHAPLSPSLKCLVAPDTLAALTFQMLKHFGQPLAERVDVTAHKLIPRQTIRLHNDYIPGGESHRLLLQLNEGWHPANGGYLMFFQGPEPEMASNIIEPVSGSVQAFAISPRSYHAVSTVHAEKRFTIVYSFYRKIG